MSRILLPGVLLALAAMGPLASADPAAGPPQAVPGPPEQTPGQVIELEADGGPFAAIYQPHRSAARRGAVVLLHDQGGSADSLEVIRPLRLGLADSGWDTLALQLPETGRSEHRRDWLDRRAVMEARLQAGLDWLGQRDTGNLAAVALGDSGLLLLRLAADRRPEGLRALVLVSAAIDDGANGDSLATLRQLPVLDVYAERDTADVIRGAAARRQAAAQAGSQTYRQLVVPAARAGFVGLEDGLVSGVRAWLAVTADD